MATKSKSLKRIFSTPKSRLEVELDKHIDIMNGFDELLASVYESSSEPTKPNGDVKSDEAVNENGD